MKIKSEQFRQVAREELKTRHTRAHLDVLGLIIKQIREASMGTFPDNTDATCRSIGWFLTHLGER